MNKKIKSTYDKLVDSFGSEEKKEFQEDLKDLLLSELILAAMEQDEISVRKLAKLAGVSPAVVQAMRSKTTKDFTMQSFFKILKGLGCKRLMVDFHGQLIPLDISQKIKK